MQMAGSRDAPDGTCATSPLTTTFLDHVASVGEPYAACSTDATGEGSLSARSAPSSRQPAHMDMVIPDIVDLRFGRQPAAPVSGLKPRVVQRAARVRAEVAREVPI